jgi:hypothetical protein
MKRQTATAGKKKLDKATALWYFHSGKTPFQ